ncbi:hypothetical protein BHM03_00047197 [Ensete ventricosum]|nr:hypothetical protein BHM03_00047197 [Ensete ventricosum]
MTRDRWRSEIPWTCEVNSPTNWERGSSLPWTNPKREAVDGLGRALARKFNSNSFTNRSNEDIEACLRREYQVLADPLRGGRESPTHHCVRRVVQGHLGPECSDVLCRIAAAIVRLEGRDDFTIELARESGRLPELPRLGAMAVPPQAGSPGVGLQATPFVEMPSGEPIGELSNSLVSLHQKTAPDISPPPQASPRWEEKGGSRRSLRSKFCFFSTMYRAVGSRLNSLKVC